MTDQCPLRAEGSWDFTNPGQPGERYIRISSDETGINGNQRVVVFQGLIVDPSIPIWGCHQVYAGLVRFVPEACQGFDPIGYMSGMLKARCLTDAEWQEMKTGARAAMSRLKQTQLKPLYTARFGNIQGVELPAGLSESQKRQFLSAFSKVRGPRQQLTDLFAAGSLYCCGRTTDRTVHFELTEQGLYCSTLGCAVLAITAGRLPQTTDPEVMFWTVHAAARLLSGSLQPLALVHKTSQEIGRGLGPGTKTQYHREGFWGPGEVFDLLVRGKSFAELAESLVADHSKELAPAILWSDKIPIVSASYASHYLTENKSFGKY